MQESRRRWSDSSPPGRLPDMKLWNSSRSPILTHAVFNGSRMLVSLYAIHLHASPFTVGALMSFYALLPMLFAGERKVDWSTGVGARWPMLAQACRWPWGRCCPLSGRAWKRSMPRAR